MKMFVITCTLTAVLFLLRITGVLEVPVIWALSPIWGSFLLVLILVAVISGRIKKLILIIVSGAALLASCNEPKVTKHYSDDMPLSLWSEELKRTSGQKAK